MLMSNDEYDSNLSDVVMDDDDDTSDQFYYSDDEDDEDIKDDSIVALENEYYNAKGEKDTNRLVALKRFENVIAMGKKHGGDKSKGWIFRALKQSVKVRMMNDEYDDAKDCYRRLLSCTDELSRDTVEKGVDGILRYVSNLLSITKDVHSDENSNVEKKKREFALYVYDFTLALFHPKRGQSTNERLWLKIAIRYGQLLYDINETLKLYFLIQDIRQSLSSSCISSTNLIEIYALETQLYSRMKNYKKIADIYEKVMQINSDVPSLRSNAVINEMIGKMQVASCEYELAWKAFLQAFESYHEVNDVRRLHCLKYLAITSMLLPSSINVLDIQYVQQYKNDPDFVLIKRLIDLFHDKDIHKFELFMERNERFLMMGDDFIKEHLTKVLTSLRIQVLSDILKPSTRISTRILSKQLTSGKISTKQLEILIATAISAKKLDIRIDFDPLTGVLIVF